MADIITVSHLIKKYKKAEHNAVDDISFFVKEGEFFAFLGPNGAGKTTTISILTTTLLKTSGQIMIGGHDLDKDQTSVRREIGVIFQKPSLDLNLTAEENVRFHAILYGLYPFQPLYSLMPTAYKQKVSELSKVLGIEAEIFQPIKTFSGGMKRKLEIIRSLIHNPKVLFLDEPTSGLDPLSRKNLWEYLQKVRLEQHTTIFLTTHYLDEAEDADRVCILNKGKIVSIGTPAQIKNHLIQEYVLVDAKDRAELFTELKTKKIAFHEEQLIKIPLHDKTAQQIVQLIHTPLTTLKIHTPTLEEAYLELI